MGERGVATQYLGIPKALVEQIEYGLRGGALQSDVEKGVFGAHGRDLPAILAAENSRAASLARFTGQGIMQLPRASQQMAATALALTVVEQSLAAGCEIAVAIDSPDLDPQETARESEAMYDAADELGKYVAHKRTQARAGEGVPAGRP